MSLLSSIEKIGNRLPHPATLFFIGLIIVMLCSELIYSLGWEVVNPSSGSVNARSLLRTDGIWWLLSHMVDNFIHFPPLGIVLVGMLGIGMAERSGLLPALLAKAILYVPAAWLTPACIFLGILSSVALDAGYVVLPPLVAALYITAGRSPIAGIAAAFAGVSAGFSANIMVTALDPLLAGFSETGARILDPDYQVADTANLYFMMVSTVVLTLSGWVISHFWVEKNIQQISVPDTYKNNQAVATDIDTKALTWALGSALIVISIIMLMIFIEGAPLHGNGERFNRWIEATVPILFFVFFIPGLVYGKTAGTIKNDKDIAQIMADTISFLGPYIVLAFFAAQFIEAFNYSGLGEMIAIRGGSFLAELALPSVVLMVLFILMAMFANLFMGSASAKYAFLAPVFVPMFMQVGISPELTQVAYRIGDSTTNVITPLNPYMVIVLAFMQKYDSKAGLGTMVSIMLPYTIGFAIVWISLIMLWMMMGWSLGPGSIMYL